MNFQIPSKFGARLLVAAIFGVLVAMLALSTTRSASHYLTYPQFRTARTFEKLSASLDAYRKANGAFPPTLSALSSLPEPHFKPDSNELIPDGWGEPILYACNGHTFTLQSLGADKQPGGVGLDCDLSNRAPRPPQAEIPFWILVVHPLVRGMVWVALGCGVLAGILAFASVNPRDLTPQGWPIFLAKMLGTLVAASLMALFVTMMHVPSGH